MVSFLQKIISLHDPEGTFVSEALWSKGVLDTAARALLAGGDPLWSLVRGICAGPDGP